MIRRPVHSNLTARRSESGRGFTLLEVMIALLVIALGMAAIMNTASDATWKSSHLRTSTIANWVAYNEIAAYRAQRVWNNDRKRTGEVDMANATWEWTMEISDTDDPSLRRLDVEVRLEDEEAVRARVNGYIGKL